MEMTRRGSCINFGNCSKADLKETIELGVTEDFVCPECESELTEIVGKKGSGGKKLPLVIGGVVLVLALVGGGLFFALSGNEADEEFDYTELSANEDVELAVSEVVEPQEETVVEPQAEKPAAEATAPTVKNAPAASSGLELGFGSYKGETKNGKAHGMGTLYFSQHHQISERDRQERYAEAGDYIVGEFYNGELVQGKLYDSSNNQKQTIILGRPN